MHSEIRRVGNSRGIILPKAILEQCHFEETVNLKVIEGGLVITPVHKRRAGWEQAFKDAEPDDKEWVW